VDIVSIGIEIYILYFLNKIFVQKKKRQKKSSISIWGICLNLVTAMHSRQKSYLFVNYMWSMWNTLPFNLSLGWT